MKKSIIIILGGITFATLFYSHYLGLNTLIYALFLIIVLAIMNHQSFLKPTVIVSAVAMMATSAAVIFHGSTIAIVCYFLSTLLFIGYHASAQVSIYMGWLNGIYNLFFGLFHSFLFQVEKVKQETRPVYAATQIARITIIPIILIVIFSLLYSMVNPVFAQWIDVDLSFIDGLWVFTAAIGALVMANIAQPQPLKEATESDIKTGNILEPKPLTDIDKKKFKNEVQVGVFSILGLNLLLIVVMISEFIFITNLRDFKASGLSDAVHSGVYASIASIVLAVVIIAIFFRGSVNFIKENKTLRQLTYAWIGLNVLLIGSIFIKNYIYMNQYGLSMKRIGVMVYLALCIVGLVTTYFKVHHKLNFVYLWRRNLAVGFVVVSIFSLVNWSAVITDYNLDKGFVDHNQLIRLYPQNAVILKKHNEYNTILEYSKNKYRGLDYKEQRFMNRDWQGFNYIAYQLQQDKEQGKEQGYEKSYR